MGTAASAAPLSYLDRIDAEPDATKLKLVRTLMQQDTLALFKELRARRPILVLTECTLVALFDDVIELRNMPNVFTAALYIPKMANGYMMMHDDDALHYREKSIMQVALAVSLITFACLAFGQTATGQHEGSASLYQYFGATAVILILVSLLPPNRSDRWLRMRGE